MVSGFPEQVAPHGDIIVLLLIHTCARAPRLQTLSGMSASDELDDSQVRQRRGELEAAFNAFNRCLHAWASPMRERD